MAVVSVTPIIPSGVSVSARGVRGPAGPALEMRLAEGVIEWRVAGQTPEDDWKSLIDLESYMDGIESAQQASEDARDLAQKWASENEDVVVEGGLYSALHHAAKAAASAGSANDDAGVASGAKTDAETARDLAEAWAEKPDGQDVDGAGTRSAKHHASHAAAQVGIATGAAGTAITKAGEASDSADAAALARDKAQDWAEKAEDAAVEAGQYSAKHHAAKAAASALAAAAFDPSSYTPTSGLADVALSGDYDDLDNKPTLGDAAAKNTGTTAGTVAAGDDSRIAGAAQKSANLSDLGNAATAFGNIKQTATDSATGVVELATASEIRSGASGALAVTPAGIKDACALTTPSGASNFAPNWEVDIVADWNVTDNRTLSNPTNVMPGTTRYVFIRASSGTRTISFGSNYKGDLPTLNDVTSSKWYLLALVAYSATHIVVTAVEASS